MVALSPERDLVTGFDAQVITKILGNDHLPLGANAMSRAAKNNRRFTGVLWRVVVRGRSA